MKIKYQFVQRNLSIILAMAWLLSPEPQQVAFPVPLVEDLLVSKNFTSATGNNIHWLRSALQVQADEIPRIAGATKGQRENPVWCSLRKLRFTASNFGDILKAVKKNRCFKHTVVIQFLIFL